MRQGVTRDSDGNEFTTGFDINLTFVGRGGNDSFLISWHEERDRFIGEPRSYVEYNPISGILSLSGSDVVQFTPGTILTPGQVSVVDADVIADYFFL